MKRLQHILDIQSGKEYVDIESIAKNYGAEIEYRDFGKINGIMFENGIGINQNLCRKIQRFTIAHELCHFILGEKGASMCMLCSMDPREKRADQFAIDLLLPTGPLKEAWEQHEDIKVISDMFGAPVECVSKKLNLLFLNK